MTKILSGGVLTLACTVASRRVADTISDGGRGAFLHGPTFMANPLACTAATASLRLLETYDWQGDVARIESELKTRLAPAKELPGVRDVRALGAVGVLEVCRLPSLARVRKVVRDTGVWLRPFGRWIYTMPPFITTTEEIRRITDAMKMLADE